VNDRVTNEAPAPASSVALPPESLRRTAFTVALVTGLVTAASYYLPTDYAATGVAIVFLAATHVLVLRKESEVIRAYGCSLGGLLEPDKIDFARVAKAGMRALIVATISFAILVGPFWFAYRGWNGMQRPFAWAAAWPDFEEVLGQLFVIALPEEAFFRGYVQSRLDALMPKRISILTLPLGPSIIVTSALFALCHLLTIPNAARLAVFFPSLLFGSLRSRENGIGASVVLHAACNLLTSGLARGYAPVHHP
jgi:uncharacterized protein